MSSSFDTIAFLANSENRVEVLEHLHEEPRTRNELAEATSFSRVTLGRILDDLEARNWIARDGRAYAATPLGEWVTEEFTELVDRLGPERDLREAVRWLPTRRIDFDPSVFADATVTVPEPGHSHRPVNRFAELIGSASTARGFGVATLAATNAETLFRRSRAGMDAEIIYPPSVASAILDTDPDAAEAAVASGGLTVLVHADPPCGLYVFDDRVILGGYDGSGVLRTVLDSGTPEAVAWGESVYRSVRRGARPFDPAEVEDADTNRRSTGDGRP
jgi:predicted transcriptional regulator